MRNLLTETLEAMNSGGVGPDDVRWVGSPEFGHTTWENFAAVAQVTDYDPGYGAPEVATDLMVVGDDWWLTRGEYDGSEWWEFNRLPDKPDAQRTVTTLSGGMWNSLAEIHAALRKAGLDCVRCGERPSSDHDTLLCEGCLSIVLNSAELRKQYGIDPEA